MGVILVLQETKKKTISETKRMSLLQALLHLDTCPLHLRKEETPSQITDLCVIMCKYSLNHLNRIETTTYEKDQVLSVK